MVELLLGMLIATRLVLLGYYLGRSATDDGRALDDAVRSALQLQDVIARLLIMADEGSESPE